MALQTNRVAILFSGGIDSSAVAAYYLLKNYRVDLLTFDNGAQRNLDLSEQKANQIIKDFPEKCSWTLLDSRENFHRVAIENLENDVKQYGNLICCGCKLVMLVQAINYCHENAITTLADGYRKAQQNYPEQTPEFMELTDKLASQYGITVEHPVYAMDTSQNLKITREAQIPTEALQANCLFGENYIQDRGESIRKYTQSKLGWASEYLDKYLKLLKPTKDSTR